MRCQRACFFLGSSSNRGFCLTLPLPLWVGGSFSSNSCYFALSLKSTLAESEVEPAALICQPSVGGLDPRLPKPGPKFMSPSHLARRLLGAANPGLLAGLVAVASAAIGRSAEAPPDTA